MRSDPQQVVENAGDFVEHGADVLRPDRRLDTQQFFDRQHIAMLVAHHGNVIKAIHVADALIVGLALGQLFGTTMQQANMRVSALDHLTVHFQHEAQHAMRCRMLRAKIHGVVANFRHRFSPLPARGSRAAPALLARCSLADK